MIEVLQWLCTGVSILGASAVAFPMLRITGFSLFLIANVLWITYGVLTGQPGIIVTNVIFCLTSGLGLFNELRAKYAQSSVSKPIRQDGERRVLVPEPRDQRHPSDSWKRPSDR